MNASAQRSNGFTLIELLVVIAIIAILSVVGAVVFSNVQKGARDSRRKADIDAIAKAYEVQKTSQYVDLIDANFASGAKPTDPNSSRGDYFNWLAADRSGFKVCAALDDNSSPACNTPALNCYCKSSVQETINPSSAAAGSSTQAGLGLGGSSSSACDPNGTLAAGLVGYWKMDEASWNGTPSEVRDLIGSYNGTAGCKHLSIDLSCPVGDFPPTTTTGILDRAGDFGGVYGYIKIPTLPQLSSVTISGWFNYIQAPSAGVRRSIMTNWWGTWGKLYLNSSGSLIWTWIEQNLSNPPNYNGLTRTITSPSLISTGNWHFFVATYDKTSGLAKLYLDNNLISPTIIGTNIDFQGPNNTMVYIGFDLESLDERYLTTNVPFYGQLDDFRVYNRALSGPEISSLYNSGAGCASP